SKGCDGTSLQALHGFLHCYNLLIDLGLDVARDIQVVIVGGDFLQSDHACDAFHILVSVVPAVDALDVLGQQLILSAASPELLGSVEDEHFIFAVWHFALAEKTRMQAARPVP